MAEYIDREAVNRISFTDAVLIDGEVRIEKIAIVRDIEKLLAADVAPVRHGRWIKCEDGTCYCSECNQNPQEWYERAIKALNYCPNCGAKMD